MSHPTADRGRCHALGRVLPVLVAAAIAIECDHDFNISTGPIGGEVVVGSGRIVAQSRTVGSFDGVRLSGQGNLRLEQAAVHSLTVEADDNILPLVRSEVVGGVLELSTQPGRSLEPSEPIRYLVTATQLASANLAGVGEIVCDGLATGRLTLESSGVGTVRFTHLNAQELEVRVSGDGDVVTSGRVDRQRLRVGGLGNYNGRSLRTSESEVEIGGLGSATVRVRDRLIVRLGGSGCVYYIGDPVVESSGSGCLEKIG